MGARDRHVKRRLSQNKKRTLVPGYVTEIALLPA
jgi:hypothetical protein